MILMELKMADTKYNYLTKINSPDDLKAIPLEKLPLVCDELRQFIIEEVSKNPGHLGSNLGTRIDSRIALCSILLTIVW